MKSVKSGLVIQLDALVSKQEISLTSALLLAFRDNSVNPNISLNFTVAIRNFKQFLFVFYHLYMIKSERRYDLKS